MALSFVANSWQLVNWGFSAGDIAVLAGAGRNVITWLSAEARDKNLLNFLSVSPTGLGIRGGLIDTASLNQRWGQTAVLFRNGRRCEFKPGGGKRQIEDNGQFTWIMTIVVCCLDIAVSNTTLMAIVVDFISGVFEDNILDIDYLQYEIPKHVDGWRSTACVRNMPPRARDIWNSLEKEQRHFPGFMPLSEKGEVVRMLLWIVTGKTSRYITASSDAFCVAVLLEEMGFALLRTGSSQDEFDESCIAVVFDDSTFSISPEASPLQMGRYGMCIPLASMEESISLWPGATSNDRRRLIFANGMKASKGIAIFASTLPSIVLERGPGIEVIGTDPQSPRSNPDAFRICERYLLVNTSVAIEETKELIDSWAVHNGAERQRIISYLDRGALLETDLEYLGDLQIFLLGYYYAALSTIVDTSQLHLQEVFGSWTWYDLEFLNMLDKLVKTGHRVNGGRYFSRHEIMRLVAYLFCGGEKEQLASISYGVVGVIGKLVVLSRSLLGDTDTVDSISKFTLLDIDPTCIPSNGRGLISCARQTACLPQTAYVADMSTFHDINGKDVDFTSQIEPAWGYDPNLCFVSYRYKGRLVHKLNPIQIEISVLKYADAGLIGRTATMTRDKVSNPEAQVAQKTQIKNCPTSQSIGTPVSANSQTSSTLQAFSTHHFEGVGAGRFGGILDAPLPTIRARQVFQGMLHHYHGGNLAWCRGINDSPTSHTEGNILLVPTQGLRRARTCILTMYKDHYREEKGGEKLDEERKSWRTHFPEALICGVSDWYLVLP